MLEFWRVTSRFPGISPVSPAAGVDHAVPPCFGATLRRGGAAARRRGGAARLPARGPPAAGRRPGRSLADRAQTSAEPSSIIQSATGRSPSQVPIAARTLDQKHSSIAA